jgi:hypothetical protein
MFFNGELKEITHRKDGKDKTFFAGNWSGMPVIGNWSTQKGKEDNLSLFLDNRKVVVVDPRSGNILKKIGTLTRKVVKGGEIFDGWLLKQPVKGRWGKKEKNQNLLYLAVDYKKMDYLDNNKQALNKELKALAQEIDATLADSSPAQPEEQGSV